MMIQSCLLLMLAQWAVGANVLLYPFGHCLNSHLLNFEKMAGIIEEGGHKVDLLINSNYEEYAHRPSTSNNWSNSLKVFKAPENFVPVCERHNIGFMLTTPVAQRYSHLMDTFYRYCDALLSDKKLLKNLKEKQYDLFIFDALDPCGRVLADYLDVPVIPLMTTGLGHWDGNPRPPSYVPSALSTFTPHMTFIQRTANFLLKLLYDVLPVLVGFDTPFEQLKQVHGINTSLSISSTFNRATLKFVNSDFAIEYPSPIEPDTIMIGGFSIDPPTALDSHLQWIVDEAGSPGIVVFSFGTLIREFDSRYLRMFLDAFSRIPQTVIMRNGNSSVPANEVPSNVKMLPWIPQNALLALPNTKLFITHCGLNGAMEAAHFGVPVIAIPIADDQYNHANKLVNHLQMGVQLDLASLSVDKLDLALQTVLNDSTYADNAVLVSSIFRDQLIGKRETIR